MWPSADWGAVSRQDVFQPITPSLPCWWRIENLKTLCLQHVFFSRPYFHESQSLATSIFFRLEPQISLPPSIVDSGFKCSFQNSGTHLKLQLLMEMVFFQHLWHPIWLEAPPMSPLSTLVISPSLSLPGSYLNLDLLNFILLNVKTCDQHHGRHILGTQHMSWMNDHTLYHPVS